jgi:hypothetical protein
MMLHVLKAFENKRKRRNDHPSFKEEVFEWESNRQIMSELLLDAWRGYKWKQFPTCAFDLFEYHQVTSKLAPPTNWGWVAIKLLSARGHHNADVAR